MGWSGEGRARGAGAPGEAAPTRPRKIAPPIADDPMPVRTGLVLASAGGMATRARSAKSSPSRAKKKAQSKSTNASKAKRAAPSATKPAAGRGAPAAKKKASASKPSASSSRIRSRRKKDDESSSPRGARSLWTGAISFGLVQIPVRLVGAEKTNELSFHQIDRHDMARIRYERVNEDTGEKVEWSDIIKGYEMPDGTLVPIEDGDFEKANVEASHTIDIQDFVERSAIPPAFFEKPYFLVPNRAAKPYAVLRDAMVKKGLVAIALVVIRTRQHLCAVVPEGKGLMLEILRFDDELKPASTVADELPATDSATAKEIALAEQLIDSLTGEWDPSKYKDTFKDDMLAAIEKKAKTGKIPTPKRARAPAKVTDLVALLRKSVQAA